MTKDDHLHNCLTNAINAVTQVNVAMCRLGDDHGLTPILDAALSSLLVVAEECRQGLREKTEEAEKRKITHHFGE